VANSSSDRWALSNWTAGKVSILQALGLKFPVDYPKLTPALTLSLATSASTSTATTTSAPGPSSSGPCNSATTTANQKLGQSLAQSYGWNTGTQWTDLNNIVMAESGWCNTIQNPTSTAYGIGQFLDSTWATVGGTKTSNAEMQIKLMLAYIKVRYGTPEQAWAFHEANGYY
jgi:hypothetical protein